MKTLKSPSPPLAFLLSGLMGALMAVAAQAEGPEKQISDSSQASTAEKPKEEVKKEKPVFTFYGDPVTAVRAMHDQIANEGHDPQQYLIERANELRTRLRFPKSGFSHVEKADQSLHLYAIKQFPALPSEYITLAFQELRPELDLLSKDLSIRMNGANYLGFSDADYANDILARLGSNKLSRIGVEGKIISLKTGQEETDIEYFTRWTESRIFYYAAIESYVVHNVENPNPHLAPKTDPDQSKP